MHLCVKLLTHKQVYTYSITTMKKIILIAFLCNAWMLSAQNVGIGTNTPSEKLDVVGNVEFSGSLEPGTVPGVSGQVLLSDGANNAPYWGVNLGAINEISRWVYPPLNVNANTTYQITANIPGVTSTSSCMVNLYGDWGPIYDDITIHHVEARTGACRFVVSNNTLWTTYNGMDFIITIIR